MISLRSSCNAHVVWLNRTWNAVPCIFFFFRFLKVLLWFIHTKVVIFEYDLCIKRGITQTSSFFSYFAFWAFCSASMKLYIFSINDDAENLLRIWFCYCLGTRKVPLIRFQGEMAFISAQFFAIFEIYGKRY